MSTLNSESCLYIIHFMSCFVSVVFGTILLVVTAKAMKATMASYIVLLRCLTIAEITASVFAIFMFPRLIPLGLDAAFIYVSGPIRYLTLDKIIWASFYVLEDHGCVQYNVFMTLCFCYRYYVLRKSAPTVKNTRTFSVAVASLISITFIGLFFAPIMTDDEMQLYLGSYVPQYKSLSKHMYGYANTLHSLATPSFVMNLLTASSQCCINISVGRAIFRLLANNASYMSEKTRRVHEQFSKALFIQSVIGQLITFSICAFVISQLGIYRSPILEYSTHMVHEFCIATSPIITLTFVRPFRAVLTSWMSVERVQSISTILSNIKTSAKTLH